MSGGAFDYWQYHLTAIADQIEEKVINNKDFNHWGLFDDSNWDGQMYSDETIKKFKEAIKYLKIAEAYAQRIDWLISGDDSEETFHERLKEDLEKIEEET